MSIQARLAAAFVIATAVATPAVACGPAPHAERVTGTVQAFGSNDLAGAIVPTYAPTWTVIVQYPRFEQSGSFLYQGRFRINHVQVSRLAQALRTQRAQGHIAALSVVLEQVARDEWRVVSFTPA